MCTPAPTRRAPTDNPTTRGEVPGNSGGVSGCANSLRILISRMCSGILRESLCSSGYRWNSWPRCPACLLLSDPARARSGSQGRPPHTSCCHGFFYHRQAKVPAITRRAYPGRVPKIHPRRPDHEEHKNLGDPHELYSSRSRRRKAKVYSLRLRRDGLRRTTLQHVVRQYVLRW